MRHKNIEALVVAHLERAGFKVYTDIPKNTEREFIAVSLVGADEHDMICMDALVSLECLSTSRYLASELAYKLDEHMKELPEREQTIVDITRTGLAPLPMFDKYHSYQALYNITLVLSHED